MSALRLEQDGAVALAVLDRPPVNALTLADYEEIAETFERLGADGTTHCVVLAAAGDKAFCAGKDLNEFLQAKPEDDTAAAAIVRRSFSAVLSCEIPVVAAVNGPALGAGAVLASVCDIRLASPIARFGLPEINVGRCGGGAHLGRHLPKGVLRRMFFTGRPISAEEALRFGFVQEVCEPEALLETAMSLAREIAAKSPLGLRIGKRALGAAEFLPVEEGYAIEQQASTELMHTDDAREALKAVLEKRPPVFRGR